MKPDHSTPSPAGLTSMDATSNPSPIVFANASAARSAFNSIAEVSPVSHLAGCDDSRVAGGLCGPRLAGMPDATESVTCPRCGEAPTSNALLLTERAEDGKRTCQALFECPACGARLWRWADRSDPLVEWTEEFWPGGPTKSTPRRTRRLP